ncbi:protein of unknown function [Magnetospirillum sp. XM-1]|nr:protein of unknown function [Magnetospirillum sp. XM-1]
MWPDSGSVRFLTIKKIEGFQPGEWRDEQGEKGRVAGAGSACIRRGRARIRPGGGGRIPSQR